MIYQINIGDALFLTEASSAAKALEKVNNEYQIEFPGEGQNSIMNIDPIKELEFGFDPASMEDKDGYYAIFMGCRESEVEGEDPKELIIVASDYEELIKKINELNLTRVSLFSDNAVIV